MMTWRFSDRLKTWFSRPQPDALPERIAILMTNPRSGSTWLFDALRCHPAIVMHPKAVIYRQLGLGGRRYPVDLSNQTAGLNVEVRAGEWATIPEFRLAAEQPLSEAVLQHPYSLEKCHPHFFKHDVATFCRRLEALPSRCTVKLVYQVRSPHATALSFLNYQARNPAWNAHRPASILAKHLQAVYRSIYELAVRKPGLIVNYDELTHDFEGTIARVLNYLWPPEQHGANGSDVDCLRAIAALTAREQRQKTGTPFLSKSLAHSSDRASEHQNSPEFADFFATDVDAIAACNQLYQAILDLQLHQK